MKKIGIVSIACVAIVALALSLSIGCRKRQTLCLFCWSDYISPDLIAQFEKENNCRVVYDTFDSNETLLTKLQAGATGYDIIFPSHYVVGVLANSGRLMELDHSRLDVKPRLDPLYLDSLPDKECRYSVPYMMSYTGIGYNKELVKDFKPTWNVFQRNDLQRKATLLDDKREVIGAALVMLGIDPNSTRQDDLDEAKRLVWTWTPNISKFENEQYRNGIASREFLVVMGYSGDIGQVMSENDEIGFCIPDEGCMMSCDMMCIPTTAKNIDLAYKFIDFIHKPENAAENITYTEYLCPNKDAYGLLPDEVKSNPTIFIPREKVEKSHLVNDQGENEAIYSKVWEEIKMKRQ